MCSLFLVLEVSVSTYISKHRTKHRAVCTEHQGSAHRCRASRKSGEDQNKMGAEHRTEFLNPLHRTEHQGGVHRCGANRNTCCRYIVTVKFQCRLHLGWNIRRVMVNPWPDEINPNTARLNKYKFGLSVSIQEYPKRIFIHFNWTSFTVKYPIRARIYQSKAAPGCVMGKGGNRFKFPRPRPDRARLKARNSQFCLRRPL